VEQQQLARQTIVHNLHRISGLTKLLSSLKAGHGIIRRLLS